MKVYELCKVLESIAPLPRQEDWDNCGLIIGEFGAEAGKILVCLDITRPVLEYAVKNEYRFIISHHPLIFRNIKRLTEEDEVQKLIMYAVKNHLSVYAMHTSYDFADYAINDHIAGILGLVDVTGYMPHEKGGYRIGRIGIFRGGIPLGQFVALVREVLKLDSLRYTGDEARLITKILIFSGAFDMEMLDPDPDLIDAIISGDIKYHAAKELSDKGISVIDAGHFGTESVFPALIQKQLRKTLPDVTIDTVDFEKDIFRQVNEQTR